MFNQNKPEGVRAFIYEYMPDYPEPYDREEKEIYIPSVKIIVQKEDVFFADHPRNTWTNVYQEKHETTLLGVWLAPEYVQELVKIAEARNLANQAEANYRLQLKNFKQSSSFHHEQFNTKPIASLK